MSPCARYPPELLTGLQGAIPSRSGAFSAQPAYGYVAQRALPFRGCRGVVSPALPLGRPLHLGGYTATLSVREAPSRRQLRLVVNRVNKAGRLTTALLLWRFTAARKPQLSIIILYIKVMSSPYFLGVGVRLGRMFELGETFVG